MYSGGYTKVNIEIITETTQGFTFVPIQGVNPNKPVIASVFMPSIGTAYNFFMLTYKSTNDGHTWGQAIAYFAQASALEVLNVDFDAGIAYTVTPNT